MAYQAHDTKWYASGVEHTKLNAAMQKLGNSGYRVQVEAHGPETIALRVNGQLMRYEEVLELAGVQDDDSVRWVGYGPPDGD